VQSARLDFVAHTLARKLGQTLASYCSFSYHLSVAYWSMLIHRYRHRYGRRSDVFDFMTQLMMLGN